jgi:pseudouridine synthase
MSEERLQKVMARAGIASRRACEEIILQGRVEVNGRVVKEMGLKVDPDKDRIVVDGQVLAWQAKPRYIYIMLYKPPGVLSVFDDPRGRPGLEQLVKAEERLFTVGRLDLESEGLMLLTNNGEIAQTLSHPRHEHAKTYLVLVDRRPGTDAIARLRHGVVLEGERTAPSRWEILHDNLRVHPRAGSENVEGVWLKVTLREGRKRQIRRMAAQEGIAVRRLIRIRIGPLTLDGSLIPGQSRPLTRTEVQRLRAQMAGARQGSRPRRRRGEAQRGRPVQRSGSVRPPGRRPTRGSPSNRPARKSPPGSNKP